VRSVNANENDSNIIEAEIKNLLDKKVIQEYALHKSIEAQKEFGLIKFYANSILKW
jgi:hypothetical protein